MEQVSSLAINPIDYKIDPNHTNFEDVINDLEQPELFQSKTYVPIDIIKTIYNSMKIIYDRMDRIEDQLDISKKFKKMQQKQKYNCLFI